MEVQVPDIRANRVPRELVNTIKKAILDRNVPSIREATIEAFDLWLAADHQTDTLAKDRDQDQPGFAAPLVPPDVQSELYAKTQLAIAMLQDVLEEWQHAQEGSAGQSPREGSESASGHLEEGDRRDPGRDRKAKAN